VGLPNDLHVAKEPHHEVDVMREKERYEAERANERETLRAELDETYGLEIHRIKEHLTEHHREEVNKLTRELTQATEEARRASTQVTTSYGLKILLFSLT